LVISNRFYRQQAEQNKRTVSPNDFELFQNQIANDLTAVINQLNDAV
jgi:hypothetical protein